MITIEISSSLRFRDLPDHLTDQFIRENTFENPKYDRLQRMGNS